MLFFREQQQKDQLPRSFAHHTGKGGKYLTRGYIITNTHSLPSGSLFCQFEFKPARVAVNIQSGEKVLYANIHQQQVEIWGVNLRKRGPVQKVNCTALTANFVSFRSPPDIVVRQENCSLRPVVQKNAAFFWFVNLVCPAFWKRSGEIH